MNFKKLFRVERGAEVDGEKVLLGGRFVEFDNSRWDEGGVNSSAFRSGLTAWDDEKALNDARDDFCDCSGWVCEDEAEVIWLVGFNGEIPFEWRPVIVRDFSE